MPPDERADIVPAATGDLSDTHDVITGVRAVELDTAEGVPRYERADILPTATRIGVKIRMLLVSRHMSWTVLTELLPLIPETIKKISGLGLRICLTV